MQTPLGRSSSPGPVPFVPNFFKNTPEDEKTWMRSFRESATMMLPSSSTATPFGRMNWPSSGPCKKGKQTINLTRIVNENTEVHASLPKYWAREKSAMTTRRRWLLKSVTTA